MQMQDPGLPLVFFVGFVSFVVQGFPLAGRRT